MQVAKVEIGIDRISLRRSADGRRQESVGERKRIRHRIRLRHAIGQRRLLRHPASQRLVDRSVVVKSVPGAHHSGMSIQRPPGDPDARLKLTVVGANQ